MQFLADTAPERPTAGIWPTGSDTTEPATAGTGSNAPTQQTRRPVPQPRGSLPLVPTRRGKATPRDPGSRPSTTAASRRPRGGGGRGVVPQRPATGRGQPRRYQGRGQRPSTVAVTDGLAASAPMDGVRDHTELVVARSRERAAQDTMRLCSEIVKQARNKYRNAEVRAGVRWTCVHVTCWLHGGRLVRPPW